jgi:hypothetical protein
MMHQAPRKVPISRILDQAALDRLTRVLQFLGHRAFNQTGLEVRLS